MSATYRALASVVMLIGFYVVALLQLAAVAALGVWLHSHTSGALTVKLLLPLLLAIGAVAVGLWKAISTKSQPAPGLILTEQGAPLLWATVRELAQAVGTRAPDEIRLAPDVNAAVSEQGRLLGLLGGRRTLHVGLPLLQGLRVDQLRAVLAHELGHYSGSHTRLGGIAYRGRLAIEKTVERISPRNPVGMVFRGYAKLYLLVDRANVRRQELEADQAAVRFAGHEAMASALRTLPALGAAWNFYESRYIDPGWSAGLAPDDFFGGYGHLLQARRDEIDELRKNAPDREPSRWDSHPPVGVRVAAMAQMPPVRVTPDDRPAWIMLADVVAAGRGLQGMMVAHGSRRLLPWPEFIAESVAAVVQQQADHIYRAAGRFTGTPSPDLPTVLDLVRAGRLGEFAEQFFTDATRKEAAAAFAGPMETLLDNASVRSGQAYWQLSWSGPARLVGRSGEPWDLAEIAKLAVVPETLNEALARLAERGVDVRQSTVVQARASARDADLIGALANIKIDGREHDVFVLDNGLVLVPDPGKSHEGEKRLKEVLGALPIAELGSRNSFLPYEEVRSVEVTKQVPLKATLTLHDGRVVQMQELMASELLEKHSRDTLLRVFQQIND